MSKSDSTAKCSGGVGGISDINAFASDGYTTGEISLRWPSNDARTFSLVAVYGRVLANIYVFVLIFEDPRKLFTPQSAWEMGCAGCNGSADGRPASDLGVSSRAGYRPDGRGMGCDTLKFPARLYPSS